MYSAESSETDVDASVLAAPTENAIMAADGGRSTQAGRYQDSVQRYLFMDSLGGCHTEAIKAHAGRVTSIARDAGCLPDAKIRWYVNTDLLPEF